VWRGGEGRVYTNGVFGDEFQVKWTDKLTSPSDDFVSYMCIMSSRRFVNENSYDYDDD
jgi:hypothetical protein